MIANTGGDSTTIRIGAQRHDEIIDLLEKILEYSNEVYETIRRRYNSRLPKNIYV